MTAKRFLVLAVVLTAALAAGSGSAAAAPDDHCQSGDWVVVGVAGDDPLYDDTTLTAGSTFDLVYCDGGTAQTNEWLDDADAPGFEAVESANDGGAVVYTVTLTGEGSETIRFADHVTLNEDEAGGLSVTVANGADGGTLEHPNDDRVHEYRLARQAVANATAELDETTTALENGETDLAAAENELAALSEAYENMTDREDALTDQLLNDVETGNSSGAVAALEALRTDASEQRDETAATVERYRGAVETERDEAQSAIRVTALGSIAAGLAVGGVAGAAVPLVAARRVEETMKLSRNVSYGRKTALVPILVGIALAVAGVALLAVVLDPSLLEVIR